MYLPQPSNMGSSENEKMSTVICFTIWEGGEGNATNHTERRVNYSSYSGFHMTNPEPVSGMQSDAYTAVDGDTLTLLSLKFSHPLN